MIQSIRKWSFYAFLFICPIVYSNNPYFQGRAFQERIFQLGAMGILALFVGNAWLSSFLILNLVSLTLNDFTIGLPQVLNVFLGCLLFMVSRAYFKNRSFMPYAKILLWLLCLNLFWMILQSSGIDPLYIAQDASGTPITSVTFRDFGALFGIKMANAMFMGITLPTLATVNLWLAPLLLLPFYYCRSSVAALSVFVSMSFFLYYTKRKLFLIFVPIAVVGGLIYVGLDLKDDPKTFGSRFPMWHAVFKYSLFRPIGYGPNSFENYTKQKNFMFYSDKDYKAAILTKIGENKAKFDYYSMDNGVAFQMNQDPFKDSKEKHLSWWDNPHNEYLQMLFEYGFFGLFLLGGLMREMYYRFKFSTKSKELVMITSSLLVFFVSGLGHFPLHLARTACLFPILLGAFYSLTDEKETL